MARATVWCAVCGKSEEQKIRFARELPQDFERVGAEVLRGYRAEAESHE